MPAQAKQPKVKAQPVETTVFMNGKSQAIRIPAQFRFKGDHVYVWRDVATGDIVLSEKPVLSWKEFFAVHRGQKTPEDFLSNRDQGSEGDRFVL